MSKDFQGIPPEAMRFLEDLSANNNRDWFQENKARYDELVKGPALVLADILAADLTRATGRAQKSKLFRVHRDVRFSKDKTPYNTHIHMAFSDAAGAANAPMWFFGLDPKGFTLGVGVFAFDKPGLETFRAYVDSDAGENLSRVISELQGQGVRVAERALKRVPAPFDRDHQRGALLRRKGLAGWIDFDDRDAGLGGGAAKRCGAAYARLMPLYRAIRDVFAS